MSAFLATVTLAVLLCAAIPVVALTVTPTKPATTQ
jgi:hypothetical protein